MKNPEELIKSNKYSEAISILKNQIKTEPNNSEILSKIGYCFLNIGKIKEAEQYFKKASKLCNDEWVWQQYGYILYKLGKLMESVKAIKQAIKYNPDNIWYFHQLAFLLLKAGDFESSLHYINTAINSAKNLTSNNYIDLLELKAEIYEQIDKDKSLEIYLTLIENCKNNPILYDKAANIVINQFNFSKNLNNLHIDGHEYYNATLLLRNGNIDEAIKLYNKILSDNKYCYPAYLGIAQALYEQNFGIIEIDKVSPPEGIHDLFKNYNQLNEYEKNIINASVAPFANFIDKLNSKKAQFYVVPVDVRLVDYPVNAYLKDKKYENMPFCTLRGLGGDNGFVGVERLRDMLWNVPDNVPYVSACAAHEYAHLVWCLIDQNEKNSFENLYQDSKNNTSFISNYSAYNVEEFFAEYYAYYAKLIATNRSIPNNPVFNKIQELQES